MKFRKLLIAGIAILGLVGVSGISVNASSFAGHYENEAKHAPKISVTRPIRLERLNNSSYFAGIRETGHTWLHRGEHISEVPFYQMRRDGFFVYVPGKSGNWYTPTNSYSWLSKVKRAHWVKRYKRIPVYKYFNKSIKPRFKYTLNQKELNKSGYRKYSGNKNIVINNFAPNNKKASIKREYHPLIWFVSSDFRPDPISYINYDGSESESISDFIDNNDNYDGHLFKYNRKIHKWTTQIEKKTGYKWHKYYVKEYY